MTDAFEFKFWAKNGRKIVGPFPTRNEAIAEFRKQFPFKGADYMAQAKRNQITTGYGNFGPSSDMRWCDARDCGRDTQ